MNKKFDKDLKYGQERENRIVSILDKDKTKLEVKTERDWWQKSGNMCIEVECYGKPSGIMATEADYWVHILADGDKDFVRMIFDTSTIKKLTKKYMKNMCLEIGVKNVLVLASFLPPCRPCRPCRPAYLRGNGWCG